MLNYPIGVQDFESLRKGGYVYVDKTDLVHKLTRGHIYFLGRPRRFGQPPGAGTQEDGTAGSGAGR